MGKRTKVIFAIIATVLTIAGGLSAYHGADKLLNPKELEKQLDFEEIKKITTPKPEIHRRILSNITAILENNTEVKSGIIKFDLIFTTEDIFSVNHPITHEGSIILENPDDVEAIHLVMTEPNYEKPNITRENYVEFVRLFNETGALLNFTKEKVTGERLKELNQFLNETERTAKFYNTIDSTFRMGMVGSPMTKGDLAFYLVIKDKNLGMVWVPLHDREAILELESYSERLQIDTNRVTVKQLEQAEIIAKSQQRSNEIMEGLGFVGLAIVFFQPAYYLLNFIFSANTRSRSHG